MTKPYLASLKVLSCMVAHQYVNDVNKSASRKECDIRQPESLVGILFLPKFLEIYLFKHNFELFHRCKLCLQPISYPVNMLEHQIGLRMCPCPEG